MATITTTKKVRKPRQKSEKKRPSKRYIQLMAEFRGHMTGDEKTQLATLDVKNAWQRINNRAMSEDNGFTSAENAKLQALCKEFVRGVKEVIKHK